MRAFSHQTASHNIQGWKYPPVLHPPERFRPRYTLVLPRPSSPHGGSWYRYRLQYRCHSFCAQILQWPWSTAREQIPLHPVHRTADRYHALPAFSWQFSGNMFWTRLSWHLCRPWFLFAIPVRKQKHTRRLLLKVCTAGQDLQLGWGTESDHTPKRDPSGSKVLLWTHRWPAARRLP